MKQLLVFSALFIALFGIVPSSSSQEIQWSNHAGGPGPDNGGPIVIDKFGNIYFSGIYEGNECYFLTDTIYQWGYNGMFIIKYDTKGNEIWVKRLGNNNVDIPQQIMDMVYDASSNMIYCTGQIYGTAQGTVFFISKLDTDGNVIWMKIYSGVSLFSCFSGLVLDENKNIYVTGRIQNTVMFDSIPVAPGGFIARFDSNGNCIWAKKKIGSNSQVDIRGIKYYNNNLFIAGYMTCDKTIFIDTIKIDHKGYGSSMIMCFDREGNVQWVTEGISKMTYSYSDLGMDKTGNIYYTGCFRDTISFSGNLLTTWAGMKDLFLVKLDKNGKVQWLKQTSASIAEGIDIISDDNGNTYVTGYFKGQAAFGNYKITSLSSNDFFLSRYNANGECKGVINFANGRGNGLSQDSDGNPSFVVNFEYTTQVGHNTYESYGSSDFIFAKCSAITGVSEMPREQQNRLVIYANPNTGKCTITMPEEFVNEKNLTLQIFDLNGRLIQQEPVVVTDGKIKLNIEAQAKGVYTAILTNGKKSYSGKIVFE